MQELKASGELGWPSFHGKHETKCTWWMSASVASEFLSKQNTEKSGCLKGIYILEEHDVRNRSHQD